MIALGLLGFALLGSVFLWVAFAAYDFHVAFDGDPLTHTASEMIKRWRREHGVVGMLVLLSLCAFFWGSSALLSLYLVLHLAFELV